MSVAIVGWRHSPFVRASAEPLEAMINAVAQGAITDAGIDPGDLDAVFLGHFNAGFSAQDFTASLVLGADPALRFKPALRVENACASGAAAVHAAMDRIRAGRARLALCVGVEKMSEQGSARIGRILLRAAWQPEASDAAGSFAGIFGAIAERYTVAHGDQSDALAAIAAKSHANGAANPLAQLRKDLGFAFCREVSAANPLVAGPLKRTDCAPVSDGAAALVLADAATAGSLAKAVAIRGTAQVSDLLPMQGRDVLAFDGCRLAWAQALDAAGLDLLDLDLVETHDCFTIAELIEYEAMGLVPRGRGAQAILEGWTTKAGRLPVNPSGGLKSKGHPIGATGVSMHVLLAMQPTGTAGGMEIPHATLAGLYNMGGVCVASYVSILERRR